MMIKYFDIHTKEHSVRCKLFANDPRSAKTAVVFGHGFAGHKDNRAAAGFAEALLSKKKDALVLAFNWPAHGDDFKKKLTLADCDRYLALVLEELTTKFAVEELYGYAVSFGAYLFLKYVSEHGDPFRKLALRSPAVDMFGSLSGTIMSGDEAERVQKGKEVRVGFDRKVPVTRELLAALRENDLRKRDFLDFADDLLILHGTADELVSFEESRAFAEENLIEFIPVAGADHRFHDPAHMAFANKAVLGFFGFS